MLLLGLMVTLAAVRISVKILSQAGGKPAEIVVDVSTDLGPISPLWQALAQGGEEKYPFAAVVNQVAGLSPRYLRIDHIYDLYEVVDKQNNQLVFDWSQLDKQVDQILATGALPFFSLSYMPPAIAQDGVVTNPPVNWEDWALVVQETVEHYSGRNGRNLPEIAYEVWNEPDLFGGWRLGGDKNYLELYFWAERGARRVTNCQPFKIGGPGISTPYKNWVNQFLDYLAENNLRIDFYSWHRYALNPEDYLQDVDAVDNWLFKNAGHTLEKYLTEWGPSSENLPLYNSNFAAAHILATISTLIQRVDLAFTFEVKDGSTTSWGILTNEFLGPVKEKPRYQALKLLNQISGSRLSFEGQGTWVSGLAAKEGKTIKILLVNLDPEGEHFENVPLTINNMENGVYRLRLVNQQGENTYQQEIPAGRLQGTFPLRANQWLLIELSKT